MVVVDSDIAIKFSGGLTNSDGRLSLGGTVSNADVPNDTLNGLWDDIDGNQLKNGSSELRFIYIKNLNTADTFAAVKAWISQPSLSSSNTITIAPGASSAGQLELTIPNEQSPAAVEVVFAANATSLANAISLGNI